MDALKNADLGFGGYCEDQFMQGAWGRSLIELLDPSIQYLKPFALTAGVIQWAHKFVNKRIVIFSDNNSVVSMVNSTSSSCKNCMVLIRILVLHSIVHNVHIYAKHVLSKDNDIANSLSRFQANCFLQLTANKPMSRVPVPMEIWPFDHIWIK